MSVLYVVATPIGNLEDISPRAIEILSQVDLIAAEDTRHSRRLLERYHILTPLVSYHDHNENRLATKLITQIKAGDSLALISDAGTPLISDPGYDLVRLAHEEKVPVVAVPGASALIAALSISGLPVQQFSFEGFLSAKAVSRQQRLNELKYVKRTMAFYEAPHRVEALLKDIVTIFGADREICVARELTKRYEQTCRGSAGLLVDKIKSGEIPQKGEFVILVEGSKDSGQFKEEHNEWEKLLRLLLVELSPSKAASIVSRVSGEKRKVIYDLALKLGKD